jgi:2-amino-4-hydroxy-6-hydroxymethyldihydropteridine diphosphokinase
MTEALLGFGANVGPVRATLRAAVDAFCDDQQVRLTARSADYRTPPWGIAAQPPFVNLCIAVETALTARALLERALTVEAAFGRNRSEEIQWGPRPLDIDILTFGEEAIDEPWLQVPHPRLLERAFVLAPLLEIRPTLSIGGVPLSEAFARLDAGGIERLPPLP